MDFKPEAFVIHQRSHQGGTAGVVTMCWRSVRHPTMVCWQWL